jgi:hypothetical protein
MKYKFLTLFIVVILALLSILSCSAPVPSSLAEEPTPPSNAAGDRAYINKIVVHIGKDYWEDTYYNWIEVDLNKGAGGEYLYLGIKPNILDGSHLGNLDVITGKGKMPERRQGWEVVRYHKDERVDADLNDGAGGDYICLIWQQNSPSILRGVTVIESKDNPDIQPPAGWTRVNVDLNKGAGGHYIYLCYTLDPRAPVAPNEPTPVYFRR